MPEYWQYGRLISSELLIKDIVKVSTLQYLSVLFTSWGFIILSITLMMLAFLRSVSASDKLLNTVDVFELRHNLCDEDTKLSDEQYFEIKHLLGEILSDSKKILKSMRYLAVVSFIIGLICLSSFVAINLSKEQIVSMQESNNKIQTTNNNYGQIHSKSQPDTATSTNSTTPANSTTATPANSITTTPTRHK